MINELLSDKNIQEAMVHVLSRRNIKDHTGLMLANLPEYWQINGKLISEIIRTGCYLPMDVKLFFRSKKNGKTRKIAAIPHVDMLLHRMLYQTIAPIILPILADCCYAYMPNRSVPDAVSQIINWVEGGKIYCARMDIRDFFDSISLDQICSMLAGTIDDSAILQLLKALLYARIIQENQNPVIPTRGLLQGSPMSPILSNFFLSRFDAHWKNCAYIRYADDIMFFAEKESIVAELRRQAQEMVKQKRRSRKV